MLIPLYVLSASGAGRAGCGRRSCSSIYTMAGSLLMLAVDHRLGLSQGTFDLVDSGTHGERLALPRLRRRLRRQGAALPVPRLAARRLPRVAAGGLGRALAASSRRRPSTASCGSRSPSSRGRRARLPHADPRARRDRARLRLAARLPRARHPRRDRVLDPRAAGADHARPLRRRTTSGSTAPSCRWSTTASSRRRSSCSPARSSAARRPVSFDRARRDGARAAGARDGADDDRHHRARGARLGGVRRRVRDPRRRLPHAAGAARSSARSRSCSRRCTCCG